MGGREPKERPLWHRGSLGSPIYDNRLPGPTASSSFTFLTVVHLQQRQHHPIFVLLFLSIQLEVIPSLLDSRLHK
jgi:hypothetical protein